MGMKQKTGWVSTSGTLDSNLKSEIRTGAKLSGRAFDCRSRGPRYKPGCTHLQNVNSSQGVKSLPCDMHPRIVLLEYNAEFILQPGHNRRLHNSCGVRIRFQVVVNVYQRLPVIQHYAITNHDAQCRTGYILGEMGWLVVFSR
ncbi:hypothetical protein TNCV_3745521 [Trichonephila clavipes]|nr:hypothetical protein TNCV_3745521 [Trichonephila clavipes]